MKDTLRKLNAYKEEGWAGVGSQAGQAGGITREPRDSSLHQQQAGSRAGPLPSMPPSFHAWERVPLREKG